jgi:hypothetical protein
MLLPLSLSGDQARPALLRRGGAIKRGGNGKFIRQLTSCQIVNRGEVLRFPVVSGRQGFEGFI